MQWNAYLADAIGWLILFVPAALVAVKLGFPQVRWWVIWLVAPVFSWIVSVGYFWAFPPNTGFGGVLARMFGWGTMLPILALFSASWLVRRWRGLRQMRFVAVSLIVLAVALPISACFRWMPEYEAKAIAAKELTMRGFTDFTMGDAERTWEGWTIYADIPNHQRYPVYLSRSGFCSGMGG